MLEWKAFEELGPYFGGLTNKTKDDFVNGNAKFITYMNVFANPSLDVSTTGVVRINEGERQNKIQKGDILFTGSSETPEEAGMSCVVTDELNEDYYMNSFCFGIRLKQPEHYNLDYLKHLLRSYNIRKEIAKAASGVTRFNISKARFGKIQIPIPSLPEQQQIANILDTFTSSIQNLKDQIALRHKQYEFYRDALLDLEGKDEVAMKTLGEIGEFERGNGIQKSDFVEEGFGCIHYGQIHAKYGFSAEETISKIDMALYKKSRKAHSGDVILATTSEDAEGAAKPFVWLGSDEVAVGSDTVIYHHRQIGKFIGHQFLTHKFLKFKVKYSTGAKVVRISGENIAKYEIALPSKEEQQRIVSILDTFESSIANLEAQLILREKQYEYYRNKLLTFF